MKPDFRAYIGLFRAGFPRSFQQETITAKPRIYADVCFMDTQDGRSDSQLGMKRIIHIVK